MQPKVSIVVPCWGVEKYLDRCVESLIKQTLQDVEIILVDDVSPDRVPQMCDEWAKKDARIKVVHKPINEGLGMACNTGIENASGKYIAFCDSDDWVEAEMYETMYNTAEEYHAQIVFTGLKRVDENGNELGFLPHRSTLEVYDGQEIQALALDMIASKPEIRADRTLQMSAKVVLYSKEIIDKNRVRFVSERMIPSEDLHFNLNVLSHCKCAAVLPAYYYNYMINTASITRKADLKRFSKCKVLYEYLLNECNELQLGIKCHERIQRLMLGQARSCFKLCSNWDISYKEKKAFCREICSDLLWNNIWATYPISKMPLVHRIVVYAMKFKLISFLLLLNNR